MPIMIPPTYKASLALLVQMDSEQRKAFVAAVAGAAGPLDLDELAEKVQSTTTLGRDQATQVVRMLFSLYLASQGVPFDTKTLVDGVCEVAEASGDKDLQPKDGNWRAFKDDLIALLSDEQSIGLTAKALDVRVQHEHVFGAARILTDMRPVFGREVRDCPIGSVVVHNLKITYREDGDEKDFYIALDLRDLRQLKELVERAIQKEETLKSTIARADMRFFDAESQ